MPLVERTAELGLGFDRADTILAAALIYQCAAGLVSAKYLVVPGVGLKEEILQEVIARHFDARDA